VGDGYTLVSFRPTWRQAIGRGLWAGVVCAAVALAVAFVAPARLRPAILVAPPLVVALAGVVAGRRGATEVDEYGIRRTAPALTQAELRRGLTAAGLPTDRATVAGLHAEAKSYLARRELEDSLRAELAELDHPVIELPQLPGGMSREGLDVLADTLLA